MAKGGEPGTGQPVSEVGPIRSVVERCLRTNAMIVVEPAQKKRDLLFRATIAPRHPEMQIEMGELAGIEIGSALSCLARIAFASADIPPINSEGRQRLGNEADRPAIGELQP